jgi:hypothetical protein
MDLSALYHYTIISNVKSIKCDEDFNNRKTMVDLTDHVDSTGSLKEAVKKQLTFLATRNIST